MHLLRILEKFEADSQRDVGVLSNGLNFATSIIWDTGDRDSHGIEGGAIKGSIMPR